MVIGGKRMSKYKVGDKATIEILGKSMTEYIVEDYSRKKIYFDIKSLDGISEPLSAYIEQARAEGQNEAWELVRKIFDMETNDIEDIFIKEDAWNLGTVLNNYTYQEAAARVAEWEK